MSAPGRGPLVIGSPAAAAQALWNYLLANADRGDNAANDEFVAELVRRIRAHRAAREGGHRIPRMLTTERGIDPAAAPTALPTMDPRLQLSAQTVAWLADRSYDRKFVRSIGNKLTDPELAGHHVDAIATPRVILSDHQFPTRTGRCRACRRHTWRRLWRRRRFPRGVWFTIDLGLQGLFTVTGRHRTPDTPQQPGTVAPTPPVVPPAHPDKPIVPTSVGGHPPSCRDDHDHGGNEVPGARAVA